MGVIALIVVGTMLGMTFAPADRVEDITNFGVIAAILVILFG